MQEVAARLKRNKKYIFFNRNMFLKKQTSKNTIERPGNFFSFNFSPFPSAWTTHKDQIWNLLAKMAENCRLCRFLRKISKNIGWHFGRFQVQPTHQPTFWPVLLPPEVSLFAQDTLHAQPVSGTPVGAGNFPPEPVQDTGSVVKPEPPYTVLKKTWVFNLPDGKNSTSTEKWTTLTRNIFWGSPD